MGTRNPVQSIWGSGEVEDDDDVRCRLRTLGRKHLRLVRLCAGFLTVLLPYSCVIPLASETRNPQLAFLRLYRQRWTNLKASR